MKLSFPIIIPHQNLSARQVISRPPPAVLFFFKKKIRSCISPSSGAYFQSDEIGTLKFKIPSKIPVHYPKPSAIILYFDGQIVHKVGHSNLFPKISGHNLPFPPNLCLAALTFHRLPTIQESTFTPVSTPTALSNSSLTGVSSVSKSFTRCLT